MHLDATEHRDGIVFLHAVKEGPASRSYGLAVAQLAGVPREVIAAAREYLAALEKGGRAHDAAAAQSALARAAPLQRTHRRPNYRSSRPRRRRPIRGCWSSRPR